MAGDATALGLALATVDGVGAGVGDDEGVGEGVAGAQAATTRSRPETSGGTRRRRRRSAADGVRCRPIALDCGTGLRPAAMARRSRAIRVAFLMELAVVVEPVASSVRPGPNPQGSILPP